MSESCKHWKRELEQEKHGYKGHRNRSVRDAGVRCRRDGCCGFGKDFCIIGSKTEPLCRGMTGLNVSYRAGSALYRKVVVLK